MEDLVVYRKDFPWQLKNIVAVSGASSFESICNQTDCNERKYIIRFGDTEVFSIGLLLQFTVPTSVDTHGSKSAPGTQIVAKATWRDSRSPTRAIYLTHKIIYGWVVCPRPVVWEEGGFGRRLGMDGSMILESSFFCRAEHQPEPWIMTERCTRGWVAQHKAFGYIQDIAN